MPPTASPNPSADERRNTSADAGRDPGDDVSVEARLAQLGLELPELPTFPAGARPLLEPVVVHGRLAFMSGIGPVGVTGIVGGDMSIDDARAAARATALLALRQLRDALGSLDAVDRWVKVLGFVRSAPGFGDQPAVVNGFTETIIEVYGDARGRCARSAIGVAELPMNIPVEVEAIVAVR
jgi:enamine deaminase RidA (YjgF/YER057c/UK114 family)